MNDITKVPAKVTDAGHSFNYSVWTAQTVITLGKVPWNADYRDIVRFPNGQADLDKYIDNGPTIQIDGATYAKFGVPVKLEIPFDVAVNYNYLRALNPTMPIQGDVGRAFYYFVNDVQYVSPSTTLFHIQLDVWQSFGYGISFGLCYVERSHLGIAQESQFFDYGRRYLTVPEGLDIGNEYRTVARWTRSLADSRYTSDPNNLNYDVLVVSTTMLEANPTKPDGSPNLLSATGSLMEGLPNGANIYIFASNDFQNFLGAMDIYPWVTQGIISITAIPHRSVYSIPGSDTTIHGVPAFVPYLGDLQRLSTKNAPSWRDGITLGIGNRYANLKKFLTYPYCQVEITAYTGSPLVVKPECWGDPDATVVEIPHFAPPSPRVAFVPYRYNADAGVTPETDGYGVVDDGAEWLDMSTGLFDFPSFSFVNNGYLSFMASNFHGIAWQNQSAEWTQQRALQSNQVAYGQEQQGISASKAMAQQSIGANTAQLGVSNQAQALRGGIGAGSNIAGGLGMAVGGNIPGAFNHAVQAASDIADAAVSINAANQSTAIQNALIGNQNRVQTNLQGYTADTNKSLADWAAKGDYANTIAGINAKVQDAKLTQPSTSGQIGGDAFNLATTRMGYDIKVKMITDAAMAVIGEYWLRYGYAMNLFTTPPANLMAMSKFTYWRMKETYITGWSCPESFKQAIRGIFEKGVTVWNNPADIGNIDFATNEPLAGVTL